MVLSGSWKATYQSSIKNQNQGGGDKKAGIPPTANIPDSVYNAYVERGNGILSLVNMRTTRMATNPNQNRPINMAHSPSVPMR